VTRSNADGALDTRAGGNAGLSFLASPQTAARVPLVAPAAYVTHYCPRLGAEAPTFGRLCKGVATEDRVTRGPLGPATARNAK
jgi:hypothetical protein